ncbi:MAG: hypothetical protein ACRYFX_25495 [Janthinobacterium lividum]
MSFPLVRPAYAVVSFEKRWKRNHRLTPAEMNELLRVLNDSESYEEGELDMAHFDSYVTFYTVKDERIGETAELRWGSSFYAPPMPHEAWNADG